MTSDELKRKLEGILNDAVTLQVYIVLKTQNSVSIKLADIDNGKTLRDLRALFINKINEELIHNEQLSILELSTTDERTNAIYHYDLDDVPEELEPIRSFNLQNNYITFSFQDDNLKDISGFILLLGTRNNNIILYKKHYPICLIKRDSFLMFKKDERFVEMEEDLIRLSSNFEFIKIGQDLFIKQLSVLEKFFGFHEIIKKEAILALDQIEAKGIIEDIGVLRETIDDVTFARKLTKVRKNSPVLTMDIPIEQIINFTKTTPALAGRFKYSDDNRKIRLDTKKSKEAFVKLLNDDFLKSELTQLYYDSLAKDKLPVTV
jgi:hypothetical protein